jgi:cholesterol transport system auxiliary component
VTLRVIAASFLGVLAASCAFERPASPASTVYDLGPPRAYAKSNPALPGSVLVPMVRAPAWLDQTDIVYRLLYEDRSRPQPYALSRWAAEPASLVTDRLRTRLAAVAKGVVSPGYSVSSDYTLRVELDDFSQVFDAPGKSRAMLRARATLLDTSDRKLIAQRVFDVEREAPPNAPGAVNALTDATDAFIEELVKWAVQSARERQSVISDR